MQVIQHIVDYAEAHGRSETILRFFSAIVKCVLHCTALQCNVLCYLGPGWACTPSPGRRFRVEFTCVRLGEGVEGGGG
jgi:hypothetical protein